MKMKKYNELMREAEGLMKKGLNPKSLQGFFKSEGINVTDDQAEEFYNHVITESKKA